jgi:protein tyrosine/serine phosphatase
MGPLERRLRNWLGRDISTPAARRRAQIDYDWLDHALLRKLSRNFHRVAEGVYRSAQPSATDLAWYQRQGIRAVLNLRGAEPWSHYLFEREACDRLGLPLIDLPLIATQAPTRDQLAALLAAFDRIERPFLMHCKSGADRTGLAAVIWLITRETTPPREAARHLDWRFWHQQRGAAGILDLFIEDFAKAHETTGIAFADWARHVYDPQDLTARFKARKT